jgi:hypothetical protein
MGYYFDHQDEIDQEIRKESEQAENDRATALRSPIWTHFLTESTGTYFLPDDGKGRFINA